MKYTAYNGRSLWTLCILFVLFAVKKILKNPFFYIRLHHD